MFLINDEDKSIYMTRGDTVSFEVSSLQADGTQYTFKSGDVVRFKVFRRKECTDVLLQKDYEAEAGNTSVLISLDGDDTKIGEFINKPTNYWYEIELNPDTCPQTIIGYDDEGEKILRLFPEGGDYYEQR